MKDFFLKLLIQVVLVLTAGIPTWLILAGRYLAEPTGFWQNLVVFGIGFYLLGGIQLIFLVGLLGLSFLLWFET